MGHIILLGDSIFDNAHYVPDGPPVIEQLCQALPQGFLASLLAVDGHITEDVAKQLKNLPSDVTHLFVSVGGNDALGESGVLNMPASTIGEALNLVQDVVMRFRQSYRSMLQSLLVIGKPTVLCTIYDSIPGLGSAQQTALGSFNEVILREAISEGLPVIDLRQVCNEPSDYSCISPIEPSVLGGSKIVRVISEVATTHDFGRRQSVIYI